jgi:GalNAc-alpha-(1->4)-GalNAc-alpha-(1->3)-diNAcBac-PP-undecaprenol alpha-1,4-N-acetyl-D-galactosaminyltransferase
MSTFMKWNLVKLILVINGLDSGGAEKSTLKLCQGLIQDGHEVLLTTITSSVDFYTLKSNLRRINLESALDKRPFFLNQRKGFRRLFHWYLSFKKILRLRRILVSEKPDCVISMSAKVTVFTFFATRFLNIPQLGSERIHPNRAIFSHGYIVDKLRPWIYKHGVSLSVQTNGVAEWCKKNWKVQGNVTPNHIETLPLDSQANVISTVLDREDIALAVSRDHQQKNLDFLLKTWSLVEKLNSELKLILVGPEKTERVENVSKNLSLTSFTPIIRTENTSPYFEKSKLFLSTSKFEGFPNVILEAISFGIPVITTPSCDLVEEFALHGAAIVVDSLDPEVFAQHIVDLFNNPERLSTMSHCAKILARKYSWEMVREDWYLAIQNAITRKS